jgi:hypothetical protein
MGIGIWLVCDFVSSASRNGCVEGLFIRPGLNAASMLSAPTGTGVCQKEKQKCRAWVSPIQNLREYAHKI